MKQLSQIFFGTSENYRPLGAVDNLMHYRLSLVHHVVDSTSGRKFSLLPKKVCNSCII